MLVFKLCQCQPAPKTSLTAILFRQERSISESKTELLANLNQLAMKKRKKPLPGDFARALQVKFLLSIFAAAWLLLL